MPQPPIKRPAPPPQEHDWQPGQRGSIAFGRLRMDIEPGTFGEPVRLHVSVPDAPPPIPEHLTLAHVFRVDARSAGGRSIRQLARPIRFTLDFADMAPREWGSGFVSLYYFDEHTRRWTIVPAQTDMRARRIVASVSHFTDYGFGTDANYLPSTPSNLEGYQVDLCSGYASASIPLKVPPGTAGLTPELVLRYNSGVIDTMNGHWIRDGNNTGNENHRTRLQSSPVGLGWSLDLGAVYRSHTQDANGHEVFYMILNGTTYQLIYVTGMTYRSSPDEFLRIRTLTGGQGESPNGSYWVIETKDGTEYRFGYTENSEQIDASGNEGGTRYAWQWNLDRIKDTHGNIIEISYLVESAQTAGGVPTVETYDQAAYPEYITYTGRAGNPDTSGNRQLRLIYADRDDQVEGYIATPVPQFRSWSSELGIGTGGPDYRDYTVGKPAGATVGDILVAVSWSNTDRAPQYPSGWTVVQDLHQVPAGSNDQKSLQVYWRKVVADEPSEYTFTACPWSNTFTAIYCWYNVDPNDPIEASGITDYHPEWGKARVPGATTTTNNGMWLAFLVGNASLGPDSTWTTGSPWNGSEHSWHMSKGLAAAATVPDYDVVLAYNNNPTIQASVFLKGGGLPTFPYTQFYQKKKLTHVEMSVAGAPVRTYELSYDYKVPYWHYTDEGDNTLIVQTEGLQKLVLTQITEKDANGTALPETTFTYYDGLISGGEYYKLQLHEIQNQYGGKVTYQYEGYTPEGWCPLRKRYRVAQKSLESGVGSAGGQSSTIVQSYSYGTSYVKADSYDYRGHADVTVTDAAGHYEKSYFFTRDPDGLPYPLNQKTSTEIERLQQRRYKLERYKSDATVTVREETDWSVSTTQGDAYFVSLDATRQYQGNASRKTRYEYDSYGNVIRTKEYTSAGADDSSWWCNTRRWYNATVNDYHYIVSKLAREAIYKPGTGDPVEGDWVRDTHHCYDGSYYWNHSIGDGLSGDDQSYRGRLTAVRRVLDATSCADVSYGYDAYGNRTSATEYDSYGTKEGSLPSTGGRTTTITYELVYNTFPLQITNPLGHVETRSYDAKWGKPSQITDSNGGATNYDYDTFGRLLSIQGPQVTGPGGLPYRRTTQYTYGVPGMANQRTTTQLLIQTRTDLGVASPSWFATRRFYDGIGRVVQEYSDGGSGVNVVNSYYDGRGLKWKDSVSHAATGTGAFLDDDWAGYAGAATSYTYDELGRPLVTTLPDGQSTQIGYLDWSSTVWDQKGHAKQLDRDLRGRVIKITEFSGTDGNLSPYAYTYYDYDLLDQLTRVTDHASNVTSIYYDTLGRKVSMTDPDMGTWVYAYDPIGTLQYQRDAKAQYVYCYYDALKRLVRKWYPVSWTQPTVTAGSSKPTVHDLMELRAAVDVNRRAAGLSASAWTNPAIIAGTAIPIRATHFIELRASIQDLWAAAGLGSVPEFTGGAIVADTRTIKASDLTDLRGWLVTYEYSTVGQVLRARVYLEYDAWDGSTQFGIGRRTALWDACGRESVWWDKAGRMTKQERTIDGAVYTTQWSYDAQGRVYQLTYSDNEVLTYGYAANGLLSQIVSSVGGTLVSGTQYNALNLPTGYTLGNQTTAQVSHTYYGPDASGSPYGALKTIQLQQGSNPKLVDRGMVYDPIGNVTSVSDGVNNETIAYTYDHLDRLLSASSPVGESFTYDEIGNLATKNGVSFSYDASHKHAVSGYNGVGYAYDANGAMTARGAQTIVYDLESRPVRVDTASTTICRFAYDGDGIRRKRLDSQGTIHYVGPYERNVGNGISTAEVVTKYYVATLGPVSRLIAFRRAGVLYWVGTDHLGSTIRVADASFNPVDGMRYLPYGGSRDAGTSLQTDHKFTSQIEDQSVGLYWYNSRAYDPAIGRFVVPDSIVPGAMNPQALNRYSYTFNNPTKYVDPTGHVGELPRGIGYRRVDPVGGNDGPGISLGKLWDKFKDWYYGTGQEKIKYGPDDPETNDIKRALGAQQMRENYVRGGYKSAQQRIEYESAAAALETFQWKVGNWTQSYVGGFWYTYDNNGDGTVTYWVFNELTRDSFLYHRGVRDVSREEAAEGVARIRREASRFSRWDDPLGLTRAVARNWPNMGNVYETFTWTEVNPPADYRASRPPIGVENMSGVPNY